MAYGVRRNESRQILLLVRTMGDSPCAISAYLRLCHTLVAISH